MDALSFHKFKKLFPRSAHFVGSGKDVPAKAALALCMQEWADNEKPSVLRAALELTGDTSAVLEATSGNVARGTAHQRYCWAFYYYLHHEGLLAEKRADVDRHLLGGKTLEEKVGGLLVIRRNLPSPSPEPGAPANDWLNAIHADTGPFVGRAAELHKLRQFAERDDPLLVCVVVGPSGAGKTRLAKEWTNHSAEMSGWDVRGLGSNTSVDWNILDPSKKTLIVLDCQPGVAQIVSAVIETMDTAAKQNSSMEKVRILVLDYAVPPQLIDLDNARRTGSDAVHRPYLTRSLFFTEAPLSLRRTDEQKDIIRGIVSHTLSRSSASEEVERVVADLGKLGEFADRPLFAALLARERLVDTTASVDRRELARRYLETSMRLPWQFDREHGLWIGFAVAVAIARGSLSFSSLNAVLAPLLHESHDLRFIEQHASQLVSSVDAHYLPGLQPLALGETFFLAFLERTSVSSAIVPHFVFALFSPAIVSPYRWLDAFSHLFDRLCANLTVEDQAARATQRNWHNVARLMIAEQWDLLPEDEQFGIKAMRCKLARELGRVGLSDLALDVLSKNTISNELPLSESTATQALYLLGSDLEIRKECGLLVEPASLLALAEQLAWHSPPLVDAATFLFQMELQHAVDLLLENPRTSRLEHQDRIIDLSIIAAFDPSPDRCLTMIDKLDSLDNWDSRFGATALIAAAQAGNVELVQQLIHRGADFNRHNRTGMTTPLMSATSGGHEHVVRQLIELGAQPDLARTDGGGWTPLFEAVHAGRAGCIQALLEGGADATLASRGGFTPLMEAAFHGFDEAVEMLCAYGASPAGEVAEDTRTPITLAAVNGHQSTTRLLMKLGASPDEMREGMKWTPLGVAALKGDERMVSLLLDSGANPNRASRTGRTPLRDAIDKGHDNIVSVLLARGADPQLTCGEGWIPLVRAASINNALVVMMLLASGADPNTPVAETGVGALLCAVHGGRPDIVRLLLESGADPNPPATIDGLTPMAHAVAQSNLEIIDLLGSFGGRLNSR